MAIRDRIVAGIRDKALQQRLLNEENLTLETAEKLIATWEIAKNNAKSMKCGSSVDQIAALKPLGFTGARLSNLTAIAARENYGTRGESNRGSVKSRLGYYPYQKDQRQQKQWRNRGQDKERNRQYSRPDYSQMVCDFCGVKGHIKRKCFKLKNMHTQLTFTHLTNTIMAVLSSIMFYNILIISMANLC